MFLFRLCELGSCRVFGGTCCEMLLGYIVLGIGEFMLTQVDVLLICCLGV